MRRMVVPVGLLGAQQLVVLEKDLAGKVKPAAMMPVLFSVLEGSDQPAFRASRSIVMSVSARKGRPTPAPRLLTIFFKPGTPRY